MSIVDEVKRNMRDRFKALDLIVVNLDNTIKETVSHLLRIEPVQAAMDFTKGFTDGAKMFIKEQCAITRRWIRRVT